MFAMATTRSRSAPTESVTVGPLNCRVTAAVLGVVTLAAGVLKVRFLPFLLLVAISKTGRYAVLLGMVDWLWP